jgi:hypothetical protein
MYVTAEFRPREFECEPGRAVRGLREAVACGPLRFHRYGSLLINGRWTVNSVPQPRPALRVIILPS